jgi:hypothetical protein
MVKTLYFNGRKILTLLCSLGKGRGKSYILHEMGGSASYETEKQCVIYKVHLISFQAYLSSILF